MRARWLLALLPLSALSLTTAAAGKTPRMPPSPAGPSAQNSEPAYFKTGVLTLQDRIWAQTQIERVFYNHRLWPKENPGPKPPFEQMVPRAVIEAKVNDSLRKSAALDQLWRHPVTNEMLQTELDRMAKQTRDPATLKELFGELHNDPRLIAETLARETLADRLIRNWYAFDTRFHAHERARSETIAEKISAEPGTDWKSLGGEYLHQIIIFDAPSAHPDPFVLTASKGTSPDERCVDAEEFAALKRKYSNPSNTGLPNHPPIHAEGKEPDSPRTPSYPHPDETPDQFLLTRALAMTESQIEIESVAIEKIHFSSWWKNASTAMGSETFAASNPSFDLKWAVPSIFFASGCDEWNYSANLYVAPDPRSEHTAIWTGSEMIVWGGASNGYLGTGGRYRAATDSWLPVSALNNAPANRANHTAVWTGTEMIVWGGNGFNTGGRYNPMNDSWTPTSIGANAPAGRTGHTAVWTGSEMIVWGGDNNPAGVLNTGARYKPSDDSWMTISTNGAVPAPRAGHSAIWTGSAMIIWGGDDTTGMMNTGGRYDPATDTWAAVSTGANVPLARALLNAVWTGSEMIIWGGAKYECAPGCGYTSYNTGGRYNPVTDSWLPTSTGANVPSPRFWHTSLWTGSELIVWGGTFKEPYLGLNTGGRYDPSSDTWRPTSQGTNLPSGRFWHTSVWTGSEMIIWGGFALNEGRTQTGGRYNPVTDTWVPTYISANIPSGRGAHTSIWTGAEMIVWGGNSNGNYGSTGGRYNAATDSWKPTSVSAATPTPRSGHTAVWTGTEMIIWGGGDNSGGKNSGARYNVANDEWFSTSVIAGTPGGRVYHTAVWTGLEMIIWGGATTNVIYNSGARYNPATDSWLPTSMDTNTPSGRYYHTAIWTGSEMIIWGGNDNGAYFSNTGGRYNPANDLWQPTSANENVPTGRYQHAAVWSGSEMIIWGGVGGGYARGDGGRYDPETDAWRPTSVSASTPLGRWGFTAVWAGSEMIIWGGWNNGDLDSGGRYNPDADRWQSTIIDKYAPTPRKYHSAIWTGSQMIIWGGSNNSQNNNGGIYTSGSVASPGSSLIGGKSPGAIRFNWNSVYGAGSYNVKRCDASAASCIPSTIVSTPTIPQYAEADNPSSYFYAVEAVNQCGATP